MIYAPIKGWFDLSKLNLPKEKFKIYSELQRIGEAYQRNRKYNYEFNRVQMEKLKGMCVEMNIDLIMNYGALERVD